MADKGVQSATRQVNGSRRMKEDQTSSGIPLTGRCLGGGRSGAAVREVSGSFPPAPLSFFTFMESGGNEYHSQGSCASL